MMTLNMSKPSVVLEDWAVVSGSSSLVYEQLAPGTILAGKVFGHAKLPDTKFIHTSRIVSVDMGKRLVETRNTMYRLGQASQDYKNWDLQHRADTAA